MKRSWLLAVLLIAGATVPRAAAATITIDASAPAGTVSPLLYGLMTEEINHGYDGGLYAELLRNRAFLDDPASPAHWSAVNGAGAAAAIALDTRQPLNATIATSLRVEVTQASSGHSAGVANAGYWGIPVKPNTRYRACFYAKGAPGLTGSITAAIESDDGKTTYASGRVSGLTQSWKQYEFTLSTATVVPTANARFVLTLDRPGTIWLSLVSLFPPTYKNRANDVAVRFQEHVMPFFSRVLSFETARR
jgi:alpha-N-arabinofuranosidase